MAALQCEICGGRLMGQPGGGFVCVSCDMEYTPDWASDRLQELRLELANLKGMFSGKRRKELEASIAELEENLKGWN